MVGTRVSLSPARFASDVRAVAPLTSVNADSLWTFPRGREENVPIGGSEPQISNRLYVPMSGTKLASCIERFDHMKRPSLSTTGRPVVLLAQPSHDDSLEMYAESLRYHGLVVVPVSDARHALMLAPQADIVVTGMNLDDPMDGVELVTRLRHDACTRSTPIIVLTACAWPEDRKRAEGAGCDLFLLKPCLPNDLLGEVRQLLTTTHSPTADTADGFQYSSPRTVRHAHG